MSIERKYITGERILDLFERGGSSMVVDFILRDSDTTITEDGLASDIVNIVNELKFTELLSAGIERRISQYKQEERY